MSEQPLYSSYGFEIIKEGDRLLLINRRVFGIAVALFVCSLITFILAINAAIQQFAWMFALAFFSGVPVLLLARQFQARKTRPLAQMTYHVLDRARGSLVVSERGTERVLVPLSEVTSVVHISLTDSTQGLMRDVKLQWQGGRVTVYHTGSKQEVQHVRELLGTYGIQNVS